MIMTRQQFLMRTGLSGQALEVWMEQEWLAPAPARTSEEARFTEADLARARLIQDLGRDLGVNDPGIGVILHLLDQLHGMRRLMSELREGLGAPAPPDEG